MLYIQQTDCRYSLLKLVERMIDNDKALLSRLIASRASIFDVEKEYKKVNIHITEETRAKIN